MKHYACIFSGDLQKSAREVLILSVEWSFPWLTEFTLILLFSRDVISNTHHVRNEEESSVSREKCLSISWGSLEDFVQLELVVFCKFSLKCSALVVVCVGKGCLLWMGSNGVVQMPLGSRWQCSYQSYTEWLQLFDSSSHTQFHPASLGSSVSTLSVYGWVDGFLFDDISRLQWVIMEAINGMCIVHLIG